MFLTVTPEPLIQCTYFVQSERGVLRGTGLFRWIWCWTHIPRRLHWCFPSDYQIRCCRGALRNLENQHALVHTHTHWLKDAHTHTGKMQDHETTKKLLGNFNSSFCFSFIPLCVFSVMWMVVSLGLYNCVCNLGYLSFSLGLWLLLYWRRAQHVQKCMYLTQSKKMVLQYVQL